MTGRIKRDELERRLEEVRRQLGARHAGIEPDAHFAARVVARLPRDQAWSIDWAARRVLPVSIAFALVLTIAVIATGRTTGGNSPSGTVSATAQNGSDVLNWLLETREGGR